MDPIYRKRCLVVAEKYINTTMNKRTMWRYTLSIAPIVRALSIIESPPFKRTSTKFEVIIGSGWTEPKGHWS